MTKDMVLTESAVHPILKSFFPMVDCLAEFFGPSFEVVLHQLTDLENSIVKICNGHITQRKIGDGMTDLGLKMIKDARNGLDILGNYNSYSKSGRRLKCNAASIRDQSGELIGFICLNMDIATLTGLGDVILNFKTMIDNFCSIDNGAEKRMENYESDLWTMVKQIIEGAIQKIQKPANLFAKEERLAVIQDLEEKGVFFAKGAIHQVATALGVSTPSIYKYLEEIRTSKQSK